MKIKSIQFKYTDQHTYIVLKTNNYSGARPGDEFESISRFYDIEHLDVIVR